MGLDAELAHEPLERHAQMHFALAPQDHFMRALVLFKRQRRIFLDELGYGTGELHFILAVGDRDGKPIDAGRHIEFDQLLRGALDSRDRLTRCHIVELAERHRLASLGPGDLLGRRSHQREQAGDTGVLALAAIDRGAVGNRPGKNPRKRQLAAMSGMEGLEDLQDGAAICIGEAKPLRGSRNIRGLVAQRLHQPQYAVAVLGRTEQDRRDQPFRQLTRQVVENTVARRLDIRKQLLHQCVIVIGEFLEHREASFLLAVEQVGRHVDDFARPVLAIDEGPFEGEIDKAPHDVILPDWDLAQKQRRGTCRLQVAQNVAQPAVGTVDLVDEDEAGDIDVVELLEDQLESGNLLVVGFADDDGGIASHEGGARLLAEFDRAGAIDKGEGLTHELDGGCVEFDTHAMRPGFRRRIADRRLFGNLALARNGPEAEQDGFEKGGFAAQIGSHECDAPRTLTFSAVCAAHLGPPYDCSNAVAGPPVL